MPPAMKITARLALGLLSAITLVLYLSSLLRVQSNVLHLMLVAVGLTGVILWIVYWRIARPLDRLTRWMEAIRFGAAAPFSVRAKSLERLAAQARQLAESLTEARAAAEQEARLRHRGEAVWTAERLKEHVRVQLDGRPLFLVANREPYEHWRKGKSVEVRTPASGLVTGLEPILRACGGVWLAHGSGDADWDVVDASDKVRVPPHDPQYALRRVWLSEQEEDGYYYGFSNEGLWPLCHIAHTRPVFEADDWGQYRAVNEKFAAALLEEMAGTVEPCVLIQDYHFALLPQLIKRSRPDARVAIFWHIPWPNPEAFDICPWKSDILGGMLGADLIGFHIQFHCNNFLDTVDRSLEAQIDWERFAVRRARRATLVKPFPISIAFPPSNGSAAKPAAEALLRELGVKARRLGVGVDRLDYTKGIVERFRAIERLLERQPRYVGDFCFVELAAPSRTLIQRYHDLGAAVEAEAARINERFETKAWRPIVLLKGIHSHAQIEPYYKAADLCLVTSLHDGMNLVAKEFVAARDDDQGVLVLSRFTGAARELHDAVPINPYDVEEVAAALHAALEMEPREQRRRMASMRRVVKEHNVYRWASRLIEELARIPEREQP